MIKKLILQFGSVYKTNLPKILKFNIIVKVSYNNLNTFSSILFFENLITLFFFLTILLI